MVWELLEAEGQTGSVERSGQGPPEGGGVPATGGEREVGQPVKGSEAGRSMAQGGGPPGPQDPPSCGVAPGELESASDASE